MSKPRTLENGWVWTRRDGVSKLEYDPKIATLLLGMLRLDAETLKGILEVEADPNDDRQ